MRRFRFAVLLGAVVLTSSALRCSAQDRKSVMTRSASLPISTYRLDMSIDGLKDLAEFSDAEYLIYGRNFDGEKNFHAPGIDLVNRHWKLALGTVWGKVYKIALDFESESKNTVIDVSTDLMKYCQQKLGKPSEQQETVYVWDAPDGNVVMQFGKAGTTYMINLVETSRSVRGFAPRR